jgi:hypothetical protein
VLAGFVQKDAASMARDAHGYGGGNAGEYDLELPSALSPAPAGCFNSPLHDSDGEDADGAASSSSSTCSGLSSSSTSSSRSSSHEDDAALCGRSSSGSSSGDEDGASGDEGAAGDHEAAGGSGRSSDGDEAAQGSNGLDASPPPRWQQQQQQHEEGEQQHEEEEQHEAGVNARSRLPGTPEPSSADAYYTPGASTPAQPPRLAMHPAMMPVGTLPVAAGAGAASAPRAVPRGGGSGSRQVQQRTRSAGDLLRLATCNAAEQLAAGSPAPKGAAAGTSSSSSASLSAASRAPRRGGHVLCSSVPSDTARSSVLAGGSSDDDEDAAAPRSGGGRHRRAASGAATGGAEVASDGCGLPQPMDAAPHQYLPVLLHFFGCSPSHQDRQLFVLLAMGLLSSCHDSLTCAQQAALLDRLEALAGDRVPGVRFAVVRALEGVRAQAAALAPGSSPQQQQQQPQQQQAHTQHDAQRSLCPAAQPHQPQRATAERPHDAGGGSSRGAAQPQAAQDSSSASAVPHGAHPLLGYQAYVQQLARTKSGSAGSSSAAGGGAGSGSSSSASSSSAAVDIEQPAGVGAADSEAAGGALERLSTSAPAHPAAGGARTSGRRRSSGSGSGSGSGGGGGGGGSGSSAARPPLPTGPAGGVRSPAAGKPPPGGSSAAAAGGAAAGAVGVGAQQSCEWLRKLSNCQQLERLLHVVAVTTGPEAS